MVNKFSLFALIFILFIAANGAFALQPGEQFCPRLEGVRATCVQVPAAAPPPTDSPPACPDGSACSINCYAGGTPKTVTVAEQLQGSCIRYGNCGGSEGATSCACVEYSPPSCIENQVNCVEGGSTSPSQAQGTCSNDQCVGTCPGGSSQTPPTTCPPETRCN